jgi:hypothetical protein
MLSLRYRNGAGFSSEEVKYHARHIYSKFGEVKEGNILSSVYGRSAQQIFLSENWQHRQQLTAGGNLRYRKILKYEF